MQDKSKLIDHLLSHIDNLTQQLAGKAKAYKKTANKLAEQTTETKAKNKRLRAVAAKLTGKKKRKRKE